MTPAASKSLCVPRTPASHRRREPTQAMGRLGPPMSLRVAFDMDGVLADFTSAYREIQVRLFGAEGLESPCQREGARGPAAIRDSAARSNSRRQHRREDAVWEVIRSTPDFWV